MQFADQLLYTLAGHISITNPYEIHANPMAEEGVKNAFTTLYLPQEVVDDLLQQKNTQFAHQQAYRPPLHELFINCLPSKKQGQNKRWFRSYSIFYKD